MRSIKMTLLLALAAVATAAVAAPGLAMAGWTEYGSPLNQNAGGASPVFTSAGAPLTGESGPITLQGNLKFAGVTGGSQNCTVTAKATLGTGGGGKISEATISAASCETAGALTPCKVVSATPGSLPWNLSATSGGAITVSGVSITYKFENRFKFTSCPFKEETVSGSLTATPNNGEAMSSVALSGSVSSSVDAGGKIVSGTLAVSPAGSYGVGSKYAIELNGSLKWQSALLGSISCDSRGGLKLYPGTEGEVEGFTWGPTPKCTTEGLLKTCTVTSVTPKSLPWGLLDEGSQVKISNLGLKMTTQGGSCPYTYIEADGTMYAVPDKASAISSLSLSGSLAMKFSNGGTDTGAWIGAYGMTPAGVYGL